MITKKIVHPVILLSAFAIVMLIVGCCEKRGQKPAQTPPNVTKPPTSRPHVMHHPTSKPHDHSKHTAHKKTKHVHKGHQHMHKGHQHHEKMPIGKPKFEAASIYQLDQTWTNQDGKKISLASLKGKIRVVAMVYTYCPMACPIIVADMKLIESKIPKELRKHVGFVLVSIDPARDTKERLKSFLKTKGLDPAIWTLLRGANDQILELAVLLGIKYKSISTTDFAHSNLITVLDKNGVIKYRQKGLSTKPDAALAVINKLLPKK